MYNNNKKIINGNMKKPTYAFALNHQYVVKHIASDLCS